VLTCLSGYGLNSHAGYPDRSFIFHNHLFISHSTAGIIKTIAINTFTKNRSYMVLLATFKLLKTGL